MFYIRAPIAQFDIVYPLVLYLGFHSSVTAFPLMRTLKV